MGALIKINEGIEKGQVRQGLGCGSERGVAVGQAGGCLTGLSALPYRVVSSTLQGCKLYLTGMQALPCRVVSSTLQSCKLYLTGLQALPCRVASSTLQGCKLYLTGLQALPCRVVSSTLQGCKVIMKYFDTCIFTN